MDIKKFFANYSGVLLENRIYRWVLLLLLVSNLVLVVLLRSNQTVVLVPPTLEKEVKVGHKQGDRAYLEAWGLFFATLMGNVTPRNIDFIMATLQRYMAPAIYQEMSQAMLEQAKTIKSGNLAVSFTVQEIVVLEGQSRVQVKGQMAMHGPFGRSQNLGRTYEIAIAVRNYAPVITDVLVHDQKQPGEDKEG
jgi:conjugal transfer pilus assembly protein TraE